MLTNSLLDELRRGRVFFYQGASQNNRTVVGNLTQRQLKKVGFSTSSQKSMGVIQFLHRFRVLKAVGLWSFSTM